MYITHIQGIYHAIVSGYNFVTSTVREKCERRKMNGSKNTIPIGSYLLWKSNGARAINNSITFFNGIGYFFFYIKTFYVKEY